MQWSLVVGTLVIAAACDRTPAAAPVVTAPPFAAEVICDDETIPVAVADELALDDALCGEPWHAWHIETARTVELVRRIDGRTVWLARRRDALVVEVRAGGRVTATHARPARIQWVAPPRPRVEDLLTVTRGATSEQITLAQLRARYPHAPGSGRGKEVSLCVLLDGADPAATVQVSGPPPAPPQVFTRAACERDGMLLHASKRGGIQLRDRTKRRYLPSVSHITLP